MATLNNRWLVYAILLTAPLLSVIDVFIINVAVPAIQKSTRATDAEVQLVIAGYLLGYAAFLITGGRAGDVFGRKKVFLLGMLSFTVLSCLCGLAQSPLQLNLARFFQGVAAAFMVPQTIAYLQVLFPGKAERTRAVGLFGITLGLASIIGQFLGGYFSELHPGFDGWRLIFFINLPIGIVALLMAFRYLQETPANKVRFDFSGVVILTTALICLIYPLVQGREAGWPLWSIIGILVSFVILGYFILHQKQKLRKGGHPLVHTGLFSYRDFNLGLLAVLFYFMVHSSYLLISTVYFQQGLGMHAYSAGQAFVFLGVGFSLSSILSVRFVIRYGKVVLQVGILIMILALWLQYVYFNESVRWSFIAGVLFIHGLGAGMVLPSLLNMALKSIPVHFAGAASGVYSTFQQTASALGVSLIGGVFFFFASQPALRSMHIAFRYSVLVEVGLLLITGFILHLLPETNDSREGDMAIAVD